MFERRQTPRQAVRLLVRHQSDGEMSPVVDYASDLSHGGLFIQTSRAVHKDETLQVEFAPMRDARLVVGLGAPAYEVRARWPDRPVQR